jgi:AGCS family alanine or glycine:cation symporter
MTGLVIVITGVYKMEEHLPLIEGDKGARLASAAFGQEFAWFSYILAVAVVLFAYSTMISWSYYGERCFTFLFGSRTSLLYRILFLIVIVLGSIVSATNVLNFSDLMILSMALPNMLGLYILSGKVRKALNDYWGMYRRGEFPIYK